MAGVSVEVPRCVTSVGTRPFGLTQNSGERCSLREIDTHRLVSGPCVLERDVGSKGTGARCVIKSQHGCIFQQTALKTPALRPTR